jgi:predicted  nucleic acid-binding Zn-ribbon protein
MTDSAPADTPVAIDRVDFTRVDRDGVDLRLTGRWLSEAAPGAIEPLLVVQVQGRRHRFAAARDGHPLPPDVWQATFRIPPWAHPRHEGQAALWVGTAVVPVPLPGVSADGAHPSPSRAALSDARAWPPDIAPPPADADRSHLPDGAGPTADTGRTGPLAELLFKESVSALHAELEQRAGEVARLQGSLADATSELEARSYRQAALESAHGDLRAELQELMSAVAAQRDDFERRLAEADERAMSAEAEREGVRAELDAVHAATAAQLEDLSAARDSASADAAELRQRLASAASGRQHHAADLSALRDQLAAAQVSRDAAAGEVAGLRAELERLGSELAVTREHQSAQGADLSEAQRLLAEARSLSERLRSQSPH